MGASRATGWTIAAASLVLATGCAQGPAPEGTAAAPATAPATAPAASPQAAPTGDASPAAGAQQGQAPGALQTITVPVGGGASTGLKARLPIDDYAGAPGQEFTFDASQSEGDISKYEWDLNGDGTFDETTTTPVLKHTFTQPFDGQLVLRVTGPLGATDTLRVPLYVGSADPRGVRRLAPPTDVRAEAVSADGTQVKLTWKSDDPDVDSWGIAVNGVPISRVEKTARSATITDVRRSKDVLIEVFGITSDFALGERAGTTLPAG